MKTDPRLWIVLPLLLLFAPAAAGEIVVSSAGSNRETAKALAANYKLHPDRLKLGQFLQLSVVDGLFDVQLVADLPTQPQPVRVEIEGSDATWVVRKQFIGAAANLTYVTVNRYEFDAREDRYWSTLVSLRANYLALIAQSGDNNSGVRVRLTQSRSILTFNCTAVNRGAQSPILNATASSLKQLQAEHPAEVRRYLTPLLRNLTGRLILRPGATDIYRVFDAIQPDESIVKTLDELLLRLEADAYEVRDRASKELAALGPEAVLAAVRRDNSDLSAEAKNRLDLFIANHSTLAIEDLATARKDGGFLLDCLEDDDRAVRAEARAALEKLIGHGVEFDVAATGDERASAVDALRRKLDSQIRPTTRPGQ